MEIDYLQLALQTFNGGNWYGWKKVDDDGNKIPNDQRMTYANIKIIKEGATMPSEADVNAWSRDRGYWWEFGVNINYNC
jgi:hypothetical protein